MAAAEVLVGEAERALVLSDFCAAEAAAREACKLAQAAGQDELDRVMLDRACVVAVQTLYETQRFGLARRLLRDSFGALASVPPHALLLWLALALDCPEHRREAERLIQELLDTCQPSDSDSSESANGSAWGRRQYLALLHLYTEVLLRELREPAEVMRWVQETQLPITAEERQLLLDELALEQQQQQPRPSPRGGSEDRDADAARGAGGLAAATALQWSGKEEEAEADEGRSFQVHEQHMHMPQREGGAGSSKLTRLHIAAAGSEIEAAGMDDGGSRGDEVVQPTALAMGWLGCCQQLLQGAAAILRPLLDLSPEQWQQRLRGKVGTPTSSSSTESSNARLGKPGAASKSSAALATPDSTAVLHQLTCTMLGCALLYAAYAERRTIKRSMGRAQRFVMGGVSDLLRMAFSLSVNPIVVSGG